MYICTIDRIVYICSKLFMIFIYFKILLYTMTLIVNFSIYIYAYIYIIHIFTLVFCVLFKGDRGCLSIV